MTQTSSARKRQLMSVVARASAAGLFALGCAAAATETSGPVASAGAGGAPVASAGAAPSAGAPTVSGAGNVSGAPAAAGSTSSAGGASAGSAPAGAGGVPVASAGSTSSSGGKCNSAGPNGEAFLDDFEDGEFKSCPSWIDGDPSLGAKWSVKTDGASKVLSQDTAVSDWIIAVSGTYKWADQTVTAKVKFTSSPGVVGVFARVQDLRNYYVLYLDGSNIILRGRVDNSQLTSVKVKKPAVQGTWYTLKLSVIGSTLTGFVDGTQLVTTTDTGVKAGGVGVGTDDSATAEFDDVTVTTP